MKAIALVILALFATAAGSAFAACTAGQMTTLVAPVEVQKKVGSTQVQKFRLDSGVEVHVTAVDADSIKIYAMSDSSGIYVNGLGAVSVVGPASLKCQL